MATEHDRLVAETAPRTPTGIENQPINKLSWVPREQLRGNDYNPNQQALPEFRLLKISIMEDGWTQPIVARSTGEIVDGFHRFKVSGDPEVSAMTGGLVPVVFLDDDVPIEQQMMSTIRHNRARGSHYVVEMATIVADLVALGCDAQEIAVRLQMDREEVDRLLDRGSMTKRRSAPGYTKAWYPTEKNGPDDDRAREGEDTDGQ